MPLKGMLMAKNLMEAIASSLTELSLEYRLTIIGAKMKIKTATPPTTMTSALKQSLKRRRRLAVSFSPINTFASKVDAPPKPVSTQVKNIRELDWIANAATPILPHNIRRNELRK